MKKLKARLLLAFTSIAIWIFVAWFFGNAWVLILSAMPACLFFLYFDEKIDELKI